MSNLQTLFASTTRYEIAFPSAPQQNALGVTWTWAANGIFKRGVDRVRDLRIQVATTAPTPGLVQLLPHVCFPFRGRIPGALLRSVLAHARRAGSGQIATPIEQQYFVMFQPDTPLPFRVVVPAQQATHTKVAYAMPPTERGAVLVDLHSHHTMPAYFSRTDDRDDTGLSVSAVIGRIFDTPEILVRANVYGHHQIIPALSVFDMLPDGLSDGREGTHADPSA